MTRRILSNLTLIALLALPLATTACSQGQSPTEPGFDLESPALSSTSGESRGGDDTSGDDRRGRGRGGDDETGDDRGRRGRGDDDNGNDDRRNGDRRRPRAPRTGQEFEGAVTAVNGGTVTISGGTRIVVNGQTQWSARGDLLSLNAVARSFRAGDNPRVEGRGTRQANGAIVAATIKAEVDN